MVQYTVYVYSSSVTKLWAFANMCAHTITWRKKLAL